MARWTDSLRMRVKTPISTYLQPLNAFRMDGVLVLYRSAVGSERLTKGLLATQSVPKGEKKALNLMRKLPSRSGLLVFEIRRDGYGGIR